MHIILLALFLAAATPGQAPKPSHFVAPEQCAFEFDYPAHWQATLLPPNKWTTCAVEIRPKNFTTLMMANGEVDIYTIHVSVPGGGTFLDTASHSGFNFHDADWITVGRHGIHGSAQVIKTEKWAGLRGTATVGCHHEHGPYAGLCDFERVVLQHGDNIWSMTGGPQTDEAFELILSTFKFIEQGPAPN